MADARKQRTSERFEPGVGETAQRDGIARREALLGAASVAGALAAAPVVAAAEPALEPVDAPTSETSEDFNGPFTAWEGYASTARHSIAPGAVPVKAPAAGSVTWKRKLAAPVGAMALRQAGQNTYAYALTETSIEWLNAETGDSLGSVDLPAAPCAGSHPVFVDAALAVVLETGQVALYDETLAPAWASAAPQVPAGAASWAFASQAVSASGTVSVALAAMGKDGAPLGIEVVSLAAIDGAPLWSASLPVGADAASPLSLQLMEACGQLLLLDGGLTARLLDITSGDVLDEFAFAGAIESRFAELPVVDGGAREWIALDAAGEVTVLGVDRGRFEFVGASRLAAIDGGAPRPLPFAPAVVRGHAFFWAAAGEDSAHAACIDVTVTEVGAIDVGSSLGRLASLPAAPLLAVTYGDNAREARVSLYALDEGGSLSAFELDAVPADDVLLVSPLWTPADALPGALALAGGALLTNRDGMVFATLAAGDQGEGALVALAPDDARAASTPVGGSEGIDTLGSTLSGIPLPNGAGVGVGALFLVATFGLYSFIRNKGGKRRRDEGLDQWRGQHGPDDSDDLDGAGNGQGASW